MMIIGRNTAWVFPLLYWLVAIGCPPTCLESAGAATPELMRTIVADVVALDQPFMWNRLGTAEPQGMMFALKRDVVSNDGDEELRPGQVMLRPDKRPRPIVLRVAVGDCLEVRFTNLLRPSAGPRQPATRNASLHIAGLELMETVDPQSQQPLPGINSDGSWVGANPGRIGSNAAPGETRIYRYYAKADGVFLLSSIPGDEGQRDAGLFGACNVQPQGAEFYRSQVTRDDMLRASYTLAAVNANPNMNLERMLDSEGQWRENDLGEKLWVLTTVQPNRQTVKKAIVVVEPNAPHFLKTSDSRHHLIDYQAQHDGRPVLSMLKQIGDGKFELCYTDLTAIITGPNAGRFPYTDVGPDFRENPALPDRRQPYREFTIHYHDALTAVQSFRQFSDPNVENPFGAGADLFAINYGMAGIGAEILANRLGVGPMGNRDAVDLKFEEFFLSSWACGDPAMVVDVPANAQNQAVTSTERGHELAQQFKFRAAPTKELIKQLDRGQSVPPVLAAAFMEHGIDLTKSALVAVVTPGNNWVVTDPNDVSGDTPPRPDRKRYPVDLAGKDLLVFEGFPPNPTAAVFNSLSKQKATKAFYADDPSNVYHSYMRDHVKFRILHAGRGIIHVHHLHAHQWLHSPNSDNGHYLDSQMINAGAAYTLEMVYNGSGNRNQTVGDSIFHCHFYPHFAAGMWSLWRVHDVFEEGTELGRDGRPIPGARALPDGEIERGTPIPGIVPLPTIGMAPMPARVHLTEDGRRVVVKPETDSMSNKQVDSHKRVYKNPGYPFFVPGISGHRPPHPPLDFAWEEVTPGVPRTLESGKIAYLDGGLPRHMVVDGKVVRELHTRWDFTKDFIIRDKAGKFVDGGLVAYELPELGTEIERVAMATHAQRAHATSLPDGDPGNFILNGLPPVPGAPYADPSVSDDGNSVINTRRYKAAVVQRDVVLNKSGWHYPQQRFITLWEDVAPTMAGRRPPQPFFFRSNTGETVEFWHTNLVPNYYELDDFQVRTPTDVLGQHIHLVKFDVTSSDGGANGFNYEDGTFSPEEVQERILAINHMGGLYASYDEALQASRYDSATAHPSGKKLHIKRAPDVFGKPPHRGAWDGAQTTIQRYDTDPLLNNAGNDRTLRTVFTHDHFSPSTHQQVGLYAGMLVEPEGSRWLDSETGEPFYTRDDGGPTSWQAIIETQPVEKSYREFALEFQDFQLAYNKSSTTLLRPISTGSKSSSAVFNLPPKFNGELAEGRIPIGLRNAFINNGITLSAKSTVKTEIAERQWLIVDPVSRENYRIVYVGSKKLDLVYAPNLTAWADPPNAINAPPDANNTDNGAPYPTLISTPAPPGTFSLNYRNEPIPLRVYDPEDPDGQGGDEAQDLSFAFNSIPRALHDLNRQPDRLDPQTGKPIPIDPNQPHGFTFPTKSLVPLGAAGANDVDPYTPLLRAYQNDSVQVRTLVGAHHDAHFFTMHGLKWFFEPSYPDSGYRNMQPMGISEHFEMLFTVPPAKTTKPFADHLYMASSGADGITNGLWGILRAYDGSRVNPEKFPLQALPNNRSGQAPGQIDFKQRYEEAPATRQKTFRVMAFTAKDILPQQSLIYNDRGQVTGVNPLKFDSRLIIENPYALIFVHAADVMVVSSTGGRNEPKYKLKPGTPIEPLVLRVCAGDWIKVTLENNFTPSQKTFTQTSKALAPFNKLPATPAVKMRTSTSVGLHPQLVSYDINQSNGFNAGFNQIQTASTAEGNNTVDYYWYAGNLSFDSAGEMVETPVEFGSANLVSSDALLQHPKGLVGALIVEPAGTTFRTDEQTRTAATVLKDGKPLFREFVVVSQDDVNLFWKDKQGNPQTYDGSTDSLNYSVEPWPYRYPQVATGRFSSTEQDISKVVSNQLVEADPQTPLFVAGAGTPVRFRLVHPGGGAGNDGQVFTIHGHVWQEEPYALDATTIGDNPLSEWFGARDKHGAHDHVDVVLDSAGGEFRVTGDYLYFSFLSSDYQAGVWGLFRVSEPNKDAVVINKAVVDGDSLSVAGSVTVNPDTGKFAEQVEIFSVEGGTATSLGTTNVDRTARPPGRWIFKTAVKGTADSIVARSLNSAGGGEYSVRLPFPPTSVTAPPSETSPLLLRRNRAFVK